MAFPIPLILLGAAGLGGLYLLAKKDEPATVPKPPVKPSGPTGPQAQAQANVMPPALRAAIDQLLANPNVNPDDLDTMAGELDKYGFQAEAMQLRMKATQLRASAPKPPAPSPAPIPIPPMPPMPPMPMPPLPIPPMPIPPMPTPVIEPPEPPPPPPPPQPSAEYAIATADVYVRAMPDSNSAVVSQEMRKGVRALVMQKGVPGSGGGGVWTRIQTPAGQQGYAAQMYLRFETAPITSGTRMTRATRQRFACCASPTGCLLRFKPQPASNGLGIVPSGACVQIIGHVEGTKSSAIAPGPGGYLHVDYQGKRGWVPAEWFELR